MLGAQPPLGTPISDHVRQTPSHPTSPHRPLTMRLIDCGANAPSSIAPAVDSPENRAPRSNQRSHKKRTLPAVSETPASGARAEWQGR